MTDLFILGNGFDRHHGLATSYGSFAQFAKENSPTVYAKLSELFAASSEYMGYQDLHDFEKENFVYDRWCDFEISLGLLDDEEFSAHSREDISEYMQELGMEEHLVEEFVSNISGILNVFRNWAESIPLPLDLRGNFTFAPSARFINFNYTETLERFYAVDQSNIFYIHGRRGTGEKLIVGHDRSPPSPKSKDDLPDIQYNPFYGYLRLTRKPVEIIEPKLTRWLETIPKIDIISVLGHSLGYVDLSYFKIISEAYPIARWRFSYFNQEDLERVHETIRILGLKADYVLTVTTLQELECNPNSSQKSMLPKLDFIY